MRTQHSIPLFKISLCVDPVLQERVKAEKSIDPRIWGSIGVKKWKQRGRGDLRGYFEGLHLQLNLPGGVSKGASWALQVSQVQKLFHGWMRMTWRNQEAKKTYWAMEPLSPGNKSTVLEAEPVQSTHRCSVTVCQRKPRLFSGCMERGKRKEHEKNCDSIVRKKNHEPGSQFEIV